MTKPISYEECLDWIHSKLKFGIKPGLQRMEWMLGQLGNPQDKIQGIHIVGTNGKGSTVANLQQIFTTSDYQVGSFTSPFILDFRERISVNGRMISQADLINLVDRVYAIVEALPEETGLEPATEFEIITVMMFLYFAEIHPVDLVLVEAGLGGRLDSTNVFTPLMVVCPSIGLDHQAILGNAHVEIAREKAGAIKSGVPFVYATEREDVAQVFEDVCLDKRAPIYRLGADFSLKNGLYSDRAGHVLETIVPGLPGQHQISNAGLAIKASLLLQEQFPRVTKETIRQGLAQTSWVGRTELLASNLMIDGAHNDESVKALCDLLKSDYADKTIHILFAAIAGKPVETMLAQLAEVGQVTVTSFDYPTALSLEQYPANFAEITDFRQWLANTNFTASHDFYVVTGSLYFISQVRNHLIPFEESEREQKKRNL